MMTLLRIIRFTFQHFWRNFWLSLITVSMLFLTLLTVNILLGLNVLTDTVVRVIEERVDVSVYFKTTSSEETVRNAAGYLRGLSQVRDVEIIAPDEALERFRVRHEKNTFILSSLEEVGGNPFGYTLVVRAQSANDFSFILEALDHPQFRDEIRDRDFSNYASLVDRLMETMGKVRVFGFVLSGVFLLIAILIIVNMVRVTVFVHREEIGIMKLVGATNTFIRAPYILEAFVYGLLATIGVVVVIFPIVAILEPWFDAYFQTVHSNLFDYFVQNGLFIFGVEFVGISFITLIFTLFAMRKYLRV
jgi:cell division transport system permease protein